MREMPFNPGVQAALRSSLRQLTERALHVFSASRPRGSAMVTPQRGLHVLLRHERTPFEATLQEPMLFLVLRGRKELRFGERRFRLGAGECALVSHDLPLVSRVLEAPYLVVLLKIDLEVLRGLYEDVGELATNEAAARGVMVHRADSGLVDAVGRFLSLVESETDARVLGPLLRKELHYRLLVAPFGQMLRSLLRYDSHASSIARATALVRRDFRLPVRVEALARAVGMSVSSFHKHFKAVTSASPLQYQKSLRLLEARRLLLAGTSVTTTAFEVGYESPTQFSREYARRFGWPPSKDLATARGSPG
jgi:AraC-like DNA-binding protein